VCEEPEEEERGEEGAHSGKMKCLGSAQRGCLVGFAFNLKLTGNRRPPPVPVDGFEAYEPSGGGAPKVRDFCAFVPFSPQRRPPSNIALVLLYLGESESCATSLALSRCGSKCVCGRLPERDAETLTPPSCSLPAPCTLLLLGATSRTQDVLGKAACHGAGGL
jgi:hypothetical protein